MHELHSTHISKVTIQNLNISVDNLQCYEFIVFFSNPPHKE